MAKPDPKQLKKEGEELKSLFAKIKKKQHNCAILLAKDGVVIEAHIKKSPEILVKLAKKKGGMAKGAWGTITMDGQVLKLDPINDKVPGNLPKTCKSYLGARGLKNRLEVLEPDGDSSSNTQSNDSSDTTEKAKELKAKLAKLQPSIDLLHKNADDMTLTSSKMGDDLTKLFNLEKTLKDTVARLESGTGTDKDGATGDNALNLMAPLVKSLVDQFHKMEAKQKTIVEKYGKDQKVAQDLEAKLDEMKPSRDLVSKHASDLSSTYDTADSDLQKLLDLEKAVNNAVAQLNSGIGTDADKTTGQQSLKLMATLLAKLVKQWNDIVAAEKKEAQDKQKAKEKAKELKAKLAKLKPSLDILNKHSDEISSESSYEKDKMEKLTDLKMDVEIDIDSLEKGNKVDISAVENKLKQMVPLLEDMLNSWREIQAANSPDTDSPEPDKNEAQKKTMARWYKREKQGINMALKDKGSKHHKNMVKWVKAYTNLLKANRIKDAQQALDEVALVLKAYEKDFKLSEKQRKDAMKRIDALKDKIVKDLSALPKAEPLPDF